MPSARSYVTPRTFRFLSDLARNNDRDWFNAHKDEYVERVRDPLCGFIEAFAPRLEKISPHMIADPRPNGGSLFRVYRDTRFAKDKSPYKTYGGMTFRHAKGRDEAAPGFYLHVEPGRIFSAAGMWHAPADALARIRDAIVDRPDDWKRLSKKVDDGSDSLKRPPRGYDPEHPFIEDLKRKSFTISTNFSQREVCSPQFLGTFAKSCRSAAPLMEFLCEAVGLDW